MTRHALCLLALLLALPAALARAEGPATPRAPAGPAPAASGAGIYVQFDYQFDQATRANGYPVAGGHQRYGWKELNPGDGVYNFAGLGRWIYNESRFGKRVGIEFTLYNGRVDQSPGIQVPDWVLAKYPGLKVRNSCYPSPEWYVIDYRVPGLRTEYARFITALADYLHSTPLNLDNPDPAVTMAANVAWVGIGLGAHGESQPVPDGGGNSTVGYNLWDDRFYQGASPCTSNKLGMTVFEWLDQWVKPVTDDYHSAFFDPARPTLRHLQLYQVSVAPTYLYRWERQVVADYSAGKRPAVGIKHAGLLYDHGFAVGDSAAEGSRDYSYDPVIRYAETPNVPTGWESYAYWLTNEAELFWGTLAALDKHPSLLLYDRNMLDTPGERAILAWAERYLGVTRSSTPSVWVALRDTGLCFTQGCATDYFPERGNHSFWLYQDDGVPGGQTRVTTWRSQAELQSWPNGAPRTDIETQHPALSIFKEKEGWIARRTDQASGNPNIFFRVDDGYLVPNFAGAVTVTVSYFDGGSDRWRLRYDDQSGAARFAVPVGGADPWVQKGVTNRWRVARFVLPDARWDDGKPLGRSDFAIEGLGDGDEIIHMVDVARVVPEACPSFASPATVGVEDLQVLAAHWGARAGEPGWDDAFDLDGDGDVDMVDIGRTVAAWGRRCP